MPFIEKSDLLPYIDQDQLDLVSQANDSYIDEAINNAIAQVSSSLRTRYDVDDTFSKTGSERDREVLENTIDIALFKLYKSSSTNMIPQHRQFLYESALKWLRDVVKGAIAINIKVAQDEDGNETAPNVIWGSNTKVDYNGANY